MEDEGGTHLLQIGTIREKRRCKPHFLTTFVDNSKDWGMYIEVLKSKIHRVHVTEANLNYIGSITIDEDLMDAAGLIAGEKVQVVNNNNGMRLITYAIPGERGSGTICLNGAAARHFLPDDIVLILSYAQMTPEEARTFRPTVIFPDTPTNKLVTEESTHHE